MALEAFDDQCTPANPRYPLISELKEIYLRAYYGAEEYEKMFDMTKANDTKETKETKKKK